MGYVHIGATWRVRLSYPWRRRCGLLVKLHAPVLWPLVTIIGRIAVLRR